MHNYKYICIFYQQVLYSSESEGSYKDKFENVKCIVQQLQKENKGIKTIVSALEEKRSECGKLQEIVQHQRREIAVLQSRLQLLGADKSTQLQENERFQPIMSQTLFNNLIAENSRLKEHQKFMNVDPDKMEALIKQVQQLTSEKQQLHEEGVSIQKRYQSLQKQLEMSTDNKDSTILKLQEQIASMKHSQDTQNILCQSLSDETTTLRQHLRDTMTQMQQIMCKMDETGSTKNKQTDNTLQPACMLPGTSRQMQILQKENEELTKTHMEQAIKLKEVIEMNSHWQRYNQQRDQHVQKLQEMLELEKQKSKSSAILNPSQQESIDQTIMQYKKKAQVAEEQKLCEATENGKLRQLVSRLQNEMRQLQKPATDANEIAVFKTQINVITEDFKQEREDRIRQHDRAEKLQEELVDAKARIDILQRSHMNDIAMRRENSLRNYEQQYQQNMYRRNIGTSQAGYVARDQRPHECDDDENQRSEDVIDAVSAEREDSMLQCPKCSRQFPANQPTELLEHLDAGC